MPGVGFLRLRNAQQQPWLRARRAGPGEVAWDSGGLSRQGACGRRRVSPNRVHPRSTGNGTCSTAAFSESILTTHEANRGAYIAVGCLIRERLALHTVANCLDVVAELYGRVCSGLTADRSFPIGYRLADFRNDGPPLEERAAYQCSPLLVADVVLQALNAEGPIDWPNTREVLLAPEEMTATDVSRYQLYSRARVARLVGVDRHGQGPCAADCAASDDRCAGLGRIAARVGRARRSCRALADERRSVPTPDVGDGTRRQAGSSARCRQQRATAARESSKRADARDRGYERSARTRRRQASLRIGSRQGRQRAIRAQERSRSNVMAARIGLGHACRRGRDRKPLGRARVSSRFKGSGCPSWPSSRRRRKPSSSPSRRRASKHRSSQPENDVAKERAALDALPDQ